MMLYMIYIDCFFPATSQYVWCFAPVTMVTTQKLKRPEKVVVLLKINVKSKFDTSTINMQINIFQVIILGIC